MKWNRREERDTKAIKIMAENEISNEVSRGFQMQLLTLNSLLLKFLFHQMLLYLLIYLLTFLLTYLLTYSLTHWS